METDVCVVGGGPAGLILGLLLARQGIRTVVVEKHSDFLRDFRGDTVHPSTLALLDDLGLGDDLAQLPHRKVDTVGMTYAATGRTYLTSDFTRLRQPHPYVMFLPQWDFLDLIAASAARYPQFTLLRSMTVTGLLRRGPTDVSGVCAIGPDGPLEIHARLTVGADGRTSTVRSLLGWRPKEFGSPMDVLWFRLTRQAADGAGLRTWIGAGMFLVGIDRGHYWQCSWNIPKGGYEAVKAAGLAKLRADIAHLVPHFADRLDEIGCWDDMSMLTVRIDRLRRWHAPGVLVIGDAAHAMSPVGGVGINLAIQDATAAARILAGPLTAGTPISQETLAAVQRRRSLPTVGTQLVQRIMQRGLLRPALAGGRPPTPSLPIRLLHRVPGLRRIPAHFFGVGLRPEHLDRA